MTKPPATAYRVLEAIKFGMRAKGLTGDVRVQDGSLIGSGAVGRRQLGDVNLEVTILRGKRRDG